MSHSFDVVVVGGGGAGLFAALSATRSGATTVLLEKTDCLGGATRQSIGLFAAAGTSLQRKRGIKDTPAEHASDMLAAGAKLGGFDSPEIAQLLAANAGETMRQLEELGVVFFGPVPHPEQSNDRLYGVLPNSFSYIYHLARAARAAGVEIRTDAPVEELITNGDEVSGVKSRGTDISARRGVILASGDFSSDPVLKASYCDPKTAVIEGLVEQNTGDGHKLAQKLGGEILNGKFVSGPLLRFVAPRQNLFTSLPPWEWMSRFMRMSLQHLPATLLRPFLMLFLTGTLGPEKNLFSRGAILVNQQGERFCNELEQPEFEIPKQPGKMAYIVFDDQLAEEFSAWPHFVSTAPGVAYAYIPDYRRNRRDLYYRARTAAELAPKLGVPVASFERTVAAAARESSPRRPLAEQGFHALGPLKSWLLVTEGGLRVSTELEVLNSAGKPIPGLYAAGGTGQGGSLLASLGNHIGWAMTSGRLAGLNAANRKASI